MPISKDSPKRISDALKDDKSKRVGDTLDFYNDSMPRRAVEGLFDKADKPKPVDKQDGYVAGYGPTSGAVPNPDAPSAGKKPVLKDDLEENISIYSSKARQARKRSFLDEEPEPDPLASTAGSGRRRLPQTPDIDDELVYSQDQSFLGELLSRFDIENLPLIKIGAGVLAVIIIFTMVSLVIKINTVNARLAEKIDELAKVDDRSAEYEQIRIENDGLKQEVTDLQLEVDELKSQLDENRPESSTSVPSENNPPPASSANTLPSDGEAGTYTVQPGDTLSKIANQFYGNSAEYQRIMDANGLTNTNILVGQTLRIPPKQ